MNYLGLNLPCKFPGISSLNICGHRINYWVILILSIFIHRIESLCFTITRPWLLDRVVSWCVTSLQKLYWFNREKANKLYQLRVLTVSKLEVEMCRFYKREQNKSEFPQQFKGEIWWILTPGCWWFVLIWRILAIQT